MQIKVEKKDLEDFQKRLEDDIAEAVFEAAKNEIKMRALALVKKNTPVDSGNLRRHWHPITSRNNLEIKIRNAASYAEYVEYGHRQNVGQFVPKIGKRLKSPWVKGVFFAQRTEEEMRRQLPSLIRPLTEKVLKEKLNV